MEKENGNLNAKVQYVNLGKNAHFKILLQFECGCAVEIGWVSMWERSSESCGGHGRPEGARGASAPPEF